MGGYVRAPEASRARLAEVARLFLKLGVIGFGGPAAHIALMREEVVARRGWVTDQEFLDLVGATNLIPGPNSTEMAIHLGYRRAGRAGLVAAGACFILPAMLLVLVLAWAYVRYGATPQGGWLLYGIKPVIIAVVVQALWRLGRAAVRDAFLGLTAAAALVLYLAGVAEVPLLLGAALAVLLRRHAREVPRFFRVVLPQALGLIAARGEEAVRVFRAGAGRVLGLTLAAVAAVAMTPVGTADGLSLSRLFLIHLKIGSVLYGSGYVLLAFLRGDLVQRLGWLTDRQLLDAVAIGQVTPGPVLTTATFVGYIMGGPPAAIVATLGIFLPGFVFVAVSHPWIARLRRTPAASTLLDGVNVAAIALMAGVLIQLGRAAIVDVPTGALAVAALLLLLRGVNSAWLVMGGAAAGVLIRLLGHG